MRTKTDNRNNDSSQEELQEHPIFSIPEGSEIDTHVNRVGANDGGIPDRWDDLVEARQGGHITNHTQYPSGKYGAYINPRYRKVIESENESEIFFEDIVDTVKEKKNFIKNIDDRNTVDDVVDFGDVLSVVDTEEEGLGEPIDLPEETIVLSIPHEEVVVDESEDVSETVELATMQDKDVKDVLKGIQEEFNKIPISTKDGRFQISQEYLETIRKKVDIASKIYTRKFALRRLKKTLTNIGKLSDGVKIMKKDSIYTVPPSLEANKLLLDILKDESILDMGNTKGKKTTLSEVLRNRSNGDKETIKSITIQNT